MTFRVNDKVALLCRGWSAPQMHRVVRVLTRYVELDDGSRWSHQGAPYPRDPTPVMGITHWTAEHVRTRRIADARQVARNVVEMLSERPPNVNEVRSRIEELSVLIESL